MNVTLFSDLILVKLNPIEKVSEGGIIIPETADKTNKKVTGIVIKHGEGFMDELTGILQPITVKEGDTVSFTFGLGIPMDIEGEDLLLLRERDLDFIFEKNPIEVMCNGINYIKEVQELLDKSLQNL